MLLACINENPNIMISKIQELYRKLQGQGHVFVCLFFVSFDLL